MSVGVCGRCGTPVCEHVTDTAVEQIDILLADRDAALARGDILWNALDRAVASLPLAERKAALATLAACRRTT